MEIKLPHNNQAIPQPSTYRPSTPASFEIQISAAANTMSNVAQQIQELTANGRNSLKFIQDESIGELIVQVVNKESGEMIRQIPSEEILHLKHIMHNLTGLFVDTLG